MPLLCPRWVTVVVEPSSAALYSSQQLQQIQSAFPELLLMAECVWEGREGRSPTLFGAAWVLLIRRSCRARLAHFLTMDCFGISYGRDLLKSRLNFV